MINGGVCAVSMDLCLSIVLSHLLSLSLSHSFLHLLTHSFFVAFAFPLILLSLSLSHTRPHALSFYPPLSLTYLVFPYHSLLLYLSLSHLDFGDHLVWLMQILAVMRVSLLLSSHGMVGMPERVCPARWL